MGREVRIAAKDFKAPLKQTWWGYLLPPIQCQSCEGIGGDCAPCEGDGTVYPKVEPPAYSLASALGRLYQGLMAGESMGDFYRERYGWQMWETTSEGSPLSPVCDTSEDLAKWLTDNGASAFGGMTATYEQWLAMIGEGSAISAMYSPATGLVSGVEAVRPLQPCTG